MASGDGLLARVFKTTADPYVGKLSLFKVLRGEFVSDSHVWNLTKAQQERLGQLFVPLGKAQEAVPKLAPGDIGAVAKLQQRTATGDTLGQKDGTVQIAPLEFPNPVYDVALSPKTKADMTRWVFPSTGLWRRTLASA